MKVSQLDMLEPDRSSPTIAGASIFFLIFVFPLAPPTPETLLSFLVHKKVEKESFLLYQKIIAAFCFHS